MRVLADGVEIGTLEGAYAERLQPATASCSTAGRWSSAGSRG